MPNIDQFTREDFEELESLNIFLTKHSSRKYIGEAIETVEDKLAAVGSGFYGRDRLAKDWKEHLRELRDKLKDLLVKK